jgi:hypothetical protein
MNAAISASEGQLQQVVLGSEGQLQVDMIAWKYASVGGLKCINYYISFNFYFGS